jgi:HAD superfamily hydrolase (TIGR01509 family)
MQSFGLDIRDKVLLFDFDGTLVESEILAQKVIDQYFDEKKTAYRAPSDLIIGRTWQAAIASMHEHANAVGARLESSEILLTEFKTRYEKALHGGVNLIPGFLECLPILKAQAKFMGIVTGSYREEVMVTLNHHGLASYFDQIWAVGDYEKSKPDPSPYLTAVRAIRADPKDVIVFEDSKAGMESATRAGLMFVQICHEAHAKTVDLRALRTVQNWTEFLIK